MSNNTKQRCHWVNDDPLYINYHDQEWGVPVYDTQTLFEFLILEGMQAGLSWYIILKKRAAIKKAFANFNIKKLAKFNSRDQERLLSNADIIRNRLKISAAITNAQAYLTMQQEGEDFADFIWQHVNNKPITNHWSSLKDIPVSTDESIALSKALKKKGFKFIGPTICYAFMQAVGMVNDHEVNCFRYQQC